MSPGQIIGIIIGVVILLIIIAILLRICRRRLRNKPKSMTKATPSAFRRSMYRLRDRFWRRQGDNLRESGEEQGDTITDKPRPAQLRRNHFRYIQERISNFFGYDLDNETPPDHSATTGDLAPVHVGNRSRDETIPRIVQDGDVNERPEHKRYTITLSDSTEGLRDQDREATTDPDSPRTRGPKDIDGKTPVPIQRPKQSEPTAATMQSEYYTEIPESQPQYHEVPQTNTEYAPIPDVPGQQNHPMNSLSTLEKKRVLEVLEHCADSDSNSDDHDYVNNDDLDMEIGAPTEGVVNHSYVNQPQSTATYHYVNTAVLEELQTAKVGEPIKPYVTVDDAQTMGILRNHSSEDTDCGPGPNLNNAYVSAEDIAHSLPHLPVELKESLDSTNSTTRPEIKSIMPP